MPARPVTKAIRARMRETACDALTRAGIPFEERNFGAMLIVAQDWIYWPGVLRWRARTGERGRRFEGTGVYALIRKIQEQARSDP